MAPPKRPRAASPTPEAADAAAVWVPLESLLPWADNPRHNASAVPVVAESIARFGFGAPIVARTADREIIKGHTRRLAVLHLGGVFPGQPAPGLVPVRWLDLSAEDAHALALSDNRSSEIATWDDAALARILDSMRAEARPLPPGFDSAALDRLLASLRKEDAPKGPTEEQVRATASSLVDRFLVPPFTVLDARQGYWQERKRTWISLGIRSEIGRGSDLTPLGKASEAQAGVYEKKADAPDAAAPASGLTFGFDLAAPKNSFDAAAAKKMVGKRGAKKHAATETSDFTMGLRKDSFAAAAAAKMVPKSEDLGGLTYHGPAADLVFYRKKKAVEAQLGRELSTDEFLRDHYEGPGEAAVQSGTSIFDPVVCELAVRWFSPPGGSVLDPFAGGSVRGIVAGVLGRSYVGVELRAEQVAANEDQAASIFAALGASAPPELPPDDPADDFTGPTPIERRGPIWLKRDDLFRIAGVPGGKVRTCYALATAGGLPAGLVTAGSRASPQVNIVAHIARRLGVPCRVHVPSGKLSPEVEAARACGAEVIQHRPGYNTVIVARAREDAARLGWREIPFGMECEEAVRQTRAQVRDIPPEVRRIVIPVGSGMSLAGLLHGLRDAGLSIPVLGVVVGADPEDRLDRFAPPDWRARVTLERVAAKYEDPAPTTRLQGVDLDPHYEAKVLPYVREGDLVWVVGIRGTAQTSDPAAPERTGPPPRRPEWKTGDSRTVVPELPGESVDLVFSCPPYADLEVYSDDPRDLSTMPYEGFLSAYRAIIRDAVARLRPDRFAVFVVGDVRDSKGYYRGFVSDTIRAFEDAGARYYNEAILVTSVGSLSMRAGRYFTQTRKLGKGHQNVLVFVKGDPKRATEACGPVEVGALPELPEGTVAEEELRDG